MCYAAIVACGGAFPKLQFGISPPEISAAGRGCLDKDPYGRGGFAGWLQYFTVDNVLLRGLGHWGEARPGYQNTTFIYI
jgi:hypothetical protein